MTNKHVRRATVVSFFLFVVPAFGQYGLFEKTADWAGRGTMKIPGSVEVTGTGTSAVYTVSGNGDDIWDNQDEGLFVYTEKEGSWTLTANVEWLDPGPNDWSKIGPMVRENPEDPASQYYSIFLRGAGYGDRTDAQWRPSEGASTTGTDALMFEGEQVQAWGGFLWLRVTRIAEKQLMLSEWSDDGQTWYLANFRTQEMTPKVAYGLAITNHDDNDVLAVATVTGVSLEPFAGVLADRVVMPGVYLGGDTQTVTISVFNPGDAAATATVEETFPEGWSASDISDGGTPTAGTITWSVSLAAGESKDLTYKLAVPADPEMNVQWFGTVGDLPVMGVDMAGLIPQLALDLKVDCPYLPNAVTLDGILGADEYAGAYMEKVDFFTEPDTPPGRAINITGTWWTPDEFNVTYHTFHDADYIYFGFDVVDPVLDFESGDTAWRNDSVELYLDGNMNRKPAPKDRNQYGFQITVVGDGHWARENDQRDVTVEQVATGGYTSTDTVWWDFGAAAKPDGSGFIVEFRLSKDGILLPPDRTLIGYDFEMNEAEDPAVSERTGKYGWFDMQADGNLFEAWDDESGWGLLELVGGPVGVYDWSVR